MGKSGLGLVLTGQEFVPTESSHGRDVWDFDRQEVDLGSERKETLLWDLAGQPGYRLGHQLSLHEMAVVLVVFDARRETDPPSRGYTIGTVHCAQHSAFRPIPLYQ